MKRLTANYNVSPSKRPNWLLRFVMYLDLPHWKVEDGHELETLQIISSKLNEHTYTQRTLKRSCRNIKRKIVGNELLIYSSTDKTLLLVINFK